MLRVDRDADAAYVELKNTLSVRTEQFTDELFVDYDEEGDVTGVEFLDISEGVDLSALPPDLEMKVGRALEEQDIRILAH